MAEVKWIKIVTDIFDDEKILIIESMPEADAMIVIWFKLLCLAGKQNNSGVFTINNRIAYTDEMFSAIFRRPINTVRLALKTFENLGMVEIVNGTVTIPNWGKHQSLEQMEARRQYERDRKREYRARQQLLSDGVNVDNSGTCPGQSTGRPTDIHSLDIDKEGDIEEERDKERSNEDSCAELPDSGHSTPEPTPSGFSILLNDGTSYDVPQADVDTYKQLYPGVDVEQALRNMIGWSMTAGPNRKTRKGIKRFITNWLIRDQDSAGKKGGGQRGGITNDTYQRAPRRVSDETIL